MGIKWGKGTKKKKGMGQKIDNNAINENSVIINFLIKIFSKKAESQKIVITRLLYSLQYLFATSSRLQVIYLPVQFRLLSLPNN